MPSTLKLLDSIIDSKLELDFDRGRYLKHIVNLCSYINAQETCDEFAIFLNRLLTEDLKQRDLLITGIVFLIADISLQLDRGNSVAMLRRGIPHLNLRGEHDRPILLVKFFDRFNEPTGIEDFLNHHGTGLTSDDEQTCLDLLQRHNPEFVANWRAQHTTDDVESS